MNQVIVLNHNTAIRANIITVRTSARQIDGISKALQIEQLKTKLRTGKIVKFAYQKKNSEIRIAYGTANPDFVKAKVLGYGTSREDFATTAYFDLEKCAWRSFR